MGKILFFVIICFLLSSSALAVDVSLDKDEFSADEIVVVTISNCEDISLLNIINPKEFPVYLVQGNGDWKTNYNTNSDSSFGKYTLNVKCSDGTSTTKGFCVNSPNCFIPVEEKATLLPIVKNHTYFNETYTEYYEDYADYEEEFLEAIDDEDGDDYLDYKDKLKELRSDLKLFKSDLKEYIEVLESDEGNNSLEIEQNDELKDTVEDLIDEIKALYTNNKLDIDEEGEDCDPEWLCSNTWSLCDINGQQIRSCVDTTGCLSTRTETRTCETQTTSSGGSKTTCTESWSCDDWSGCVDGKQTRDCNDLNICGTYNSKPVEEQSCSEDLEIIIPNTAETDPVSQSGSSENILETKNNIFSIILISSSLILLIVIGVLIYFLFIAPSMKKKKELKSYILKERNKGISNQRIRSALIKSGWKESRVNKALK